MGPIVDGAILYGPNCIGKPREVGGGEVCALAGRALYSAVSVRRLCVSVYTPHICPCLRDTSYPLWMHALGTCLRLRMSSWVRVSPQVHLCEVVGMSFKRLRASCAIYFTR